MIYKHTYGSLYNYLLNSEPFLEVPICMYHNSSTVQWVYIRCTCMVSDYIFEVFSKQLVNWCLDSGSPLHWISAAHVRRERGVNAMFT